MTPAAGYDRKQKRCSPAAHTPGYSEAREQLFPTDPRKPKCIFTTISSYLTPQSEVVGTIPIPRGFPALPFLVDSRAVILREQA